MRLFVVVVVVVDVVVVDVDDVADGVGGEGVADFVAVVVDGGGVAEAEVDDSSMSNGMTPFLL